MYLNRRKTILTIISVILVFSLGYFHAEVDALFINERSLVGLLFVAVLVLSLVIFYLKYEILRMKLNQQKEYNNTDDLRHQTWKLEEELRKLKNKK